ncbi:MAG: hypothetical protein GXP10_01065 [Gammaproteobacteria bacterium]|nr:hypothetical protein [Gammaproteobacteria bacterium]
MLATLKVITVSYMLTQLGEIVAFNPQYGARAGIVLFGVAMLLLAMLLTAAAVCLCKFLQLRNRRA